MNSVSNKPVTSKARWLLTAPLRLPRGVAVLNAFALLVFIILLFLGAGLFWQIQLLNAVLGDTSINNWRGLTQADRQILLLRSMITMSPDQFDVDAFELQRSLVNSRFDVLNSAQYQDAVTDDIKAVTRAYNDTWTGLQGLLDQIEANPQDTALREQVEAVLSDLSRDLIATDTTLQRNNIIFVTNASQGNTRLFIGIAVTLVLFIVFAVAVGFSLYRFFRQQEIANNKARAALAAEAAAYEANAFKDQFFATMSHELRTPLNGIIGYLGVAKMTEEMSPSVAYLIDRTRANAERLLILINDILDLSKIEAGRLDIHETAVDVRSLVQKWQSQIEILAKDKQLTFTVHVDEQVPQSILSDEDALTKICTNLLSNAVKFTETGSVALTLKPESQELVIEVSDTGIGIPAHMQDLIFESFRQADSSTRRKYGGTGLGLSIVQRLCRVMGGSIRVSSVQGSGSTFTVTLPLKIADSIVPASNATDHARGRAEPETIQEVSR